LETSGDGSICLWEWVVMGQNAESVWVCVGTRLKSHSLHTSTYDNKYNNRCLVLKLVTYFTACYHSETHCLPVL